MAGLKRPLTCGAGAVREPCCDAAGVKLRALLAWPTRETGGGGAELPTGGLL